MLLKYLCTCLKVTVCLLVLTVCISIPLLTRLYTIKSTGEVFLDNAPGPVSIMRETDTGIIHVKGKDWRSVAYGQGFACA